MDSWCTDIISSLSFSFSSLIISSFFFRNLNNKYSAGNKEKEKGDMKKTNIDEISDQAKDGKCRMREAKADYN